MDSRLTRDFYARPATIVAKELLGKRLVRVHDRTRISGFIVETEAYCDSEELDLACHGDRANRGRPTSRTAVMFGPAGFVYMYFNYGLHWMFNVVTGREGKANAVLIRAIQPDEGAGAIAGNRPGRSALQWTNGPAKLTQALAMDGLLNGADLCNEDSSVWFEDSQNLNIYKVDIGPRIGLGKTPEPWLSMPWRFWVAGNEYVSKRPSHVVVPAVASEHDD